MSGKLIGEQSSGRAALWVKGSMWFEVASFDATLSPAWGGTVAHSEVTWLWAEIGFLKDPI